MKRDDLLKVISSNKTTPIMVQTKFNGGYRFVEVNRVAFVRLLKSDFSDKEETGIDPIRKNNCIWMEMNSSAEH